MGQIVLPPPPHSETESLGISGMGLFMDWTHVLPAISVKALREHKALTLTLTSTITRLLM